MAGREGSLTQKKIAVDVFHIPNPGDPQAGVSVRTAAARLRSALQKYYRTQAATPEIRIAMPARRFYITAEAPPPSPPEQIRPSVEEDFIPVPAKKLSESDIIGQRGINLIEKTCLDMGFVWHPTGLEAGIDGYVEIRLQTGEVTNCIIQVQSKATERSFEAETASSFEFRCSPRDLEYWLGGNALALSTRSGPL